MPKTPDRQQQDLINKLTALTRALKEGAKQQEEASMKMSTSTNKNIQGQVFLDRTMSRLSGALKEMVAVQESAVAVTGRFRDVIGPAMENATSNMARTVGGFAKTVEDQITMLREGLRGNMKDTMKLAIQMRITGQNQRKMIQQNAILQALGNVENDALRDLSHGILNLSQDFNITATALMDAIALLQNEMVRFGELDISQSMIRSVRDLQAALGKPQLGKMLQETISTLTEGSVQGMVDASKLGLTGYREAIAAGQGDFKLLADMILEGGQTWANQMQIAKNAGDSFLAQGIMYDKMGGRLGRNLLVLRRELLRNGVTSEELQKSLGRATEVIMTWRGAMDEVLSTWKTAGGLMLDLIGFISPILPALSTLTVAIAALTMATKVQTSVEAGGFLHKIFTRGVKGVAEQPLVGGFLGNILTKIGTGLAKWGPMLLKFAGRAFLWLSLIQLALFPLRWLKDKIWPATEKIEENTRKTADTALIMSHQRQTLENMLGVIMKSDRLATEQLRATKDMAGSLGEIDRNTGDVAAGMAGPAAAAQPGG